MERVERDYEGFLRLLNKYKVRYCIVGAFAVAFYAIPRYTKDIDILIEPSRLNAERMLNALKEFGFGSMGLSIEDFAKEGMIIQLGYEPVRIDIVTSINGCSFEKVWRNRRRGRYGRAMVNFIGLNELIENKRAASRKQDMMDIEILLKIKRFKKG